LACALLAASTSAQRDFSDVQVKATPVAGAVHMLEGAGGNVGVSVGEDGILLVDDQLAPLADKIRAALAEIGKGKIAFVLNTHYHGDHTGGNASFGREATILAHGNVRKRLAAPSADAPARPKEALPVITFEESLSVHFNGEEIRAIHLPHGHTDGDLVVLFTRSNVAHLGDQFFNGRFPYVDRDAGGTVRGYVANVATLLDRLPPDVRIIPGHGALATLEDLRRFHGMLVATVNRVVDAVRAGQTLEQMKADKILAPWDEWSSSFITTERWLETVHRELTAG
jgi:glyoxylase-like metal-dependent hydrolase (beta-lactamase superfamily II)